MSLKIKEFSHEADGAARLSGLFDGAPFRMIAEGGRWLFRTASGWAHAQDASDPASLPEARLAAYGAVAAYRNHQRFS